MKAKTLMKTTILTIVFATGIGAIGLYAADVVTQSQTQAEVSQTTGNVQQPMPDCCQNMDMKKCQEMMGTKNKSLDMAKCQKMMEKQNCGMKSIKGQRDNSSRGMSSECKMMKANSDAGANSDHSMI